MYRLPPHVYASPCLPTYPVPFSDVSLVAALQRMSTSYCHPTTTAPPPSLSSSCNPLHQLGDLPPPPSLDCHFLIPGHLLVPNNRQLVRLYSLIRYGTHQQRASFFSFVRWFFSVSPLFLLLKMVYSGLIRLLEFVCREF